MLYAHVYLSYTTMTHYFSFDHKGLVPHKVQGLWNSCGTARVLQMKPRLLSLRHDKFRFSSEVKCWCRKMPTVVEEIRLTSGEHTQLLNQQWKQCWWPTSARCLNPHLKNMWADTKLPKENLTFCRHTKPVHQPIHSPSTYLKPKIKVLRIHRLNYDVEFNEF